MVLAKDIEDGFDLDRIDTEMKMEKIRQSASKLTWDGFGQALRRNLMEKRLVCDAESRMDILQAISTMRRSLPVDEKSDLQTKLKQLADSLECNFTTQPGLIFMRNAELLLEFLCDGENVSSCKIGYFGRLPMDSDYMRNLIKQGDFITLRSSIYAMLATVPNSLNGTEKMACVTALDILEVFLANQSGAPTFEKINTMPWGWLYPRDSLRAARIYYVAEPSYIINSGRTHVDAGNDFDELPYMELSVVQCEKETQMPNGANINSEPWSSTRPIFACFCLRFSVPMLFSYSTWKKMEQYLVKTSVVKHHINLYRYMSNYNFEEPELTLRTNLPAKYPQHCYSVSADILKEERDSIISELNIRSAADISKIISLVRAQAIHNSLWESFLSMCCGRWKGGETIKMRVVPSSTCYEVCFTAVDRVVVARFEMTKDLNWVAAIEGSDGQPLTTSLNADITARINKS